MEGLNFDTNLPIHKERETDKSDNIDFSNYQANNSPSAIDFDEQKHLFELFTKEESTSWIIQPFEFEFPVKDETKDKIDPLEATDDAIIIETSQVSILHASISA